MCAVSAGAEEFRTPSVSAVRVEWRAVLDQLRSEINALPAIASDLHVGPLIVDNKV